jgi:aerobic-type carbon monoxide dehydrogenase small subunit (CoxS/CutS family)
MDQPENPHAPQPTDVPDAPDAPRSGVTRRAFIKGVIASGAVATSAAYLFRTSGEIFGQTSAPGSVERLITLNVNGQMRRVDVMKQETLATTLRYKLGLTGTEDRLRQSRMRRLHGAHRRCAALFVLGADAHRARAQGADDRGLANGDQLHPVQQAIVDEQGFQCAFCMSGFTMAAVGFLKTNPNPTRQQLAHGISGNLLSLSGLRQDPHGVHARR